MIQKPIERKHKARAKLNAEQREYAYNIDMKTILTFDIGTTSVKTCLFDRGLNTVCTHTEEYHLLTGGGENWVELDPEVYWRAVLNGIRAVAPEQTVRDSIAAICISTQGETLICVDREGNALRRAIVWLDARADAEGAYISALPGAKDVYARCGVAAIDGMTPISKLLWIRRNEPEIYDCTYKFLLLGDYIAERLTGRFVSEKTLMSTTAYYDIRADRRMDAWLAACGIDPEKIPDALGSGEIIGGLTAQAARETGLPENVCVVAGAMDQVAAAIGGGNVREGVITETTGTAMVLLATADEGCFNSAGGVNIYRHAVPGKYLVIPFCITAGVVLKWFKDEFCAREVDLARQTGRSVYDILGEMAEKCAPGANGLTLIPYFNGILQPHASPNQRGIFFGASLQTGKSHFIRAIFEGVACMLRENVELLEKLGVRIDEIRSFGGGANSAIWSQIKADITGKRIVTLREGECASLGVAVLAAAALGWARDIESAAEHNHPSRAFVPNAEAVQTYDSIYARYCEILKRNLDLF